MRTFACPNCQQALYFENTACLQCGESVALDADAWVFRRVNDQPRQAQSRRQSQDQTQPQSQGHTEGQPSAARCANFEPAQCNWLAQPDHPEGLCRACGLNRTIPDQSVAENADRWRRLEAAKRRMVYGLARFGLPLIDRATAPEKGLAFDFLADGPHPFREGEHVMTGHAEGLITLNIAEADPQARVAQRESNGERYRTLLGHFRHEVGHYYWERLIRDGGQLDAFRAVFGDETVDYAEALKAHYGQPDTGAWRGEYVSHYAASHPWEDWAESWAHVMHMVGTLDTAGALGLAIRPARGRTADLDDSFDAHQTDDFAELVSQWRTVSTALNSLNRSMGQPDAYPFVLSDTVTAKLAYVHQVIRCAAGQSLPRAG